MPSDYSLTDLAKIAGVSVRTVRYYIAQGLLPSPVQQGPNTRYSDLHLDRLRLIKRLQNAHLPLAEIRRQLETMPDDRIATLSDPARAYEPPADSALDYIESLLQPGKPAFAIPVAPSPTMYRRIAPSVPLPSTAPPTTPTVESDRTQWERISLDPDFELHVRRPLTRQHNKQVERLIKIARELLREE
jgi:DNA-binding transcriptional MerR regulator